MESELISKRKEELEKELAALEKKQKDFLEQDTFIVGTNTAYIQNMKVFDGWTDFVEWIQTKHEQSWNGEVDSHLEVTFKIKRKKKNTSKEAI